MYEFNYQLTPDHLTVYRRLLMKRLTSVAASKSWWQSPLGGMLVIFATTAVVSFLAAFYMPRVTGQPFDPLAMIAGAWIGIAFVAIAGQHRMRGFRGAMYRADGPTLSPHRAVFDAAGMSFESANAEAHYKWPLFMDLSEAGPIVVLWIEPGNGIPIPRSALGDEAKAKAFCDFARAQIAAAKAGQ